MVFGLPPGLLTFGFGPVAFGLSAGLDLSRRAASGICPWVPLQQPWAGGVDANHFFRTLSSQRIHTISFRGSISRETE